MPVANYSVAIPQNACGKLFSCYTTECLWQTIQLLYHRMPVANYTIAACDFTLIAVLQGEPFGKFHVELLASY